MKRQPRGNKEPRRSGAKDRVCACVRRVAGCATPTGSAGHAGATANLKLTFHLDHSAGADQQRITPAAVATFNAMLATNDATLYDELLSQLHDQLDLLPWQGPAVVDPGEECPYPKDTAAYEWWPTAQALYRLLSQAAAAR